MGQKKKERERKEKEKENGARGLLPKIAASILAFLFCFFFVSFAKMHAGSFTLTPLGSLGFPQREQGSGRPLVTREAESAVFCFSSRPHFFLRLFFPDNQLSCLRPKISSLIVVPPASIDPLTLENGLRPGDARGTEKNDPKEGGDDKVHNANSRDSPFCKLRYVLRGIGRSIV